MVVIDANANLVARVGRYGNVDDEGVRFVWPRALCVSDTAMYVADTGNRRILKASISYYARQASPLP